MIWTNEELAAFKAIGSKLRQEPCETPDQKSFVALCEYFLKAAWRSREKIPLSRFVVNIVVQSEEDAYKWQEGEGDFAGDIIPNIEGLEARAQHMTRIRKDYFAEMIDISERGFEAIREVSEAFNGTVESVEVA